MIGVVALIASRAVWFDVRPTWSGLLKGIAVTLSFPNASRSYDPGRRCITFWGHDSAFEISFRLDAASLQRLSPHKDLDEAAALRVFDLNRARIERAALDAYSRGRRQTHHSLTASDF
jgi:hypothetical protein